MIKRSSIFKRDFKKAMATPRHKKDIVPLFTAIIESFLIDHPLPF